MVVLTKADLAEDVDAAVRAVRAVAPGVEVAAVCSVTAQGVDALARWLRPGRTAVLLGSSGVGKSTLANRLMGGDVLRTGAVREDGKGRHTTTHRQLLLLANGALLIDTPGMRELQLWSADAGMDAAFADVEALAARCRFGDCAHRSEPGCAVRAAAEVGGDGSGAAGELEASAARAGLAGDAPRPGRRQRRACPCARHPPRPPRRQPAASRADSPPRRSLARIRTAWPHTESTELTESGSLRYLR